MGRLTEEIFMSADEPPQVLASKANGSTPPAGAADVPAEAVPLVPNQDEAPRAVEARELSPNGNSAHSPRDFDTADFLARHDIHLKSTDEGQHYSTCPKCSAGRSRANQKKECLNVKIDDKGACWWCAHCGWSGPEKGAGGFKKEFAATYNYTDEDGAILFQVCRRQTREGKEFPQRRPDGKGGWLWGTKGVRKVLFHLPEVIAAIDEGRTVFVVEGEKDVESLARIGFVATCNPGGASEEGKRPKWRSDFSKMLRMADVVVIPDNDAPGYAHASAIVDATTGIAKRIRVLKLADHWPAGECPKGGDVSDWLAAGGTREKLDELLASASEFAVAQATAETPKPAPQPETPKPHMSLDELHSVFRRWLGDHYDIDTIDATLATAAGEKLGGDPCWLLIISGPGNAKTETVQALSGCGAHITSTIQSEGALLSASSKKDRTKTATGGLLRKIGDRGVLVIKDVTSILSSDRNSRGPVLAAIREIYDGRWERNVGSDGGQTITWTGRIAVIGACTTAWDSAHAVIAACGDRFVVIRSDSEVGRQESGLQAMRNVGHETQMRAELAEAVGCVIYHADIEATTLTDVEMSQIMKASDITTYARTAVEFDYSGEVIDSHMPEAPTRFAKQLAQLFRGCVALGMARDRAMQLVIRCARDSVPPLRLSILLDLAAHPDSRPGDVRARIGKPWRTVKRSLEALTMIGLTECDERRDEGNGVDDDKRKTVWRYRLSSTLDRETLLAMAGQTTPAACQVMAAEVQQRIGAGQPLAPTHVQALEAIRGRLKAGEQLSLSEERLLSASMTTEF
jgi:DNA-binding transcriptional ArsR family regulator